MIFDYDEQTSRGECYKTEREAIEAAIRHAEIEAQS